MLTRLSILLGLVPWVLGAAVIENEGEANRDGKIWWPVKYVIDYRNTSCTTDSGYQGYCFMQFECTKGGGVADGECGHEGDEFYGVCCDYTAGGDTTISTSGEYFSNKGYPSGDDKAGIKTAELEPPPNTCQVKLTFEEFDLLGPSEGDCNNDTFVVSGANSDFEVPVLCGYNTGQHMYINVDSSEGPWKLIQTSSDEDYERKFNVKVEFFECDDCKAPPRCLQYYPDTEGEMMSFNYNPDSADNQMLNNQDYIICFGYNPGKCDIGINVDRLDLGPEDGDCDTDDYLRIGFDKYCGDVVDISLQANSTGLPVQFIHVSSDDENAIEMEGFMASYMMMPCE